MRHVWVLTFVLLLLSGTANAEFRALLVGIDYKNRIAGDTVEPLCGAVNDVDEVYRLMTGTLGIPGSSIKPLKESRARKADILHEFERWLIDGSKPGDTLFFQFAGHGVLVEDKRGDQIHDPLKRHNPRSQRLAEALVPYDTKIDVVRQKVDNIIRDSDLKPLLDRLTDRQLTLFVDSCHSGGLTRGRLNLP